MLIFIDTEFTGLGVPDPKLISLALVAEDGRREFYAELSDGWCREDCTTYVLTKVLPLLDGTALLTSAQLRVAVWEWLESSPRRVQIASDSIIDFQFLFKVLGGRRPPNMVSERYDLRSLIDTTVFDTAVKSYYGPSRHEHHALHDARALRKGWLAYMDKKKATGR